MAFPQLARYPALGPSLWSFEKLPSGARGEPVPVVAADGGESHGTLYTRGGEKVVALLMHPRGDMQRHYAVPALLEGGVAAWGQAGRYINNDVNLIHERILLDVAAAIRQLKDRGFERIVLLGNSGGGALYTFYQAQAATPPPGRLRDTAAGDACDLNGFEMPPADGIVQLATHLGQGKLMLSIIDPSVTEESDPLSRDPSLDMYDPRNGFQRLPEQSRYSPEFLVRYEAGQRARVARIDAVCREHVAEWNYWLAKLGASDFDALPVAEKQRIERRALTGRYFAVHRTEAHPAYTDLSLWPSERAIGSFFSPRPDVFNYLEAGFGKYQTPRAWLSTWSGLSSRASTLDCISRIVIPTLVVAYAGDNAVFNYHTNAIAEASPAEDKQHHTVRGDHLGYGPKGMGDRSGQQAALEIIVPWIQERFC
ncbi:MAG TPA: alpha/beta hydrolase [Myxococcota bacterium]|nr:alpha/beta hydrolase [Myxococcota bacterium]